MPVIKPPSGGFPFLGNQKTPESYHTVRTPNDFETLAGERQVIE
jgi:hypothetical protein